MFHVVGSIHCSRWSVHWTWFSKRVVFGGKLWGWKLETTLCISTKVTKHVLLMQSQRLKPPTKRKCNPIEQIPWFLFTWAVLSDEQMSKRWPFSLLNNEQMSNWLGVEHQPVTCEKKQPFFCGTPEKLYRPLGSTGAPKLTHTISMGISEGTK